MATLRERLEYVMSLDARQAIQSFDQVGKAADKNLSDADRKLDKLGGNLTKFGAGAVAAAGVAGAGLFKLAQGAAESEAAMAALEQVVGGVAAQEIGRWAEDSAKNVGLASKEAVAAATSFAGLGKIVGLNGEELSGFSIELVKMAADLAAFKDVSPQQALEDLQSVFAGSTEVGRKYNIFLDDATLKQAYFNETGEKVTGTLTSQQRIVATNAEIFRQGADAVGQWNRESGELMGQQAQLRANLTNLGDAIGAGVLPMVTQMTAGLVKVSEAFTSLSPETQATIGKFAGLAAGGVALLGTLSLVAGQVIKMRDRFTTLVGEGENATRQLNNFGKAAKGAGIAILGAAAALAAYQAAQAKNAQDVNELADAFAETGRMADAELGLAVEKLVALGEATHDLKPAVDQFVQGNIEAARRLLETGAAAQGGAEFVDLLTAAIANEERARSQAAKTAEEYADQTDASMAATAAETEAIEAGTAAQRNLTKEKEGGISTTDLARRKAEQHRDAVKAEADAMEEAKRRTEELASAKLQLVGGDIAVREAQRQANEALAAFVEVAGDSESSAEDVAAAQDDAARAMLAAAQAAADNEIAQREAAGEQLSASEKALIMRDRLGELAGALDINSPLRSQLRGYMGDLLAIPREITTTVRVNQQGVRVGGGSSSQQRNATGTPFSGGEFLAGEHGPEIVRVPNGSRVEPAWRTDELQRSRQAPVVNNTTNVVHVHHPRREVMDEIALWERRNGPRDQDRRSIA